MNKKKGARDSKNRKGSSGTRSMKSVAVLGMTHTKTAPLVNTAAFIGSAPEEKPLSNN